MINTISINNAFTIMTQKMTVRQLLVLEQSFSPTITPCDDTYGTDIHQVNGLAVSTEHMQL